MSTGGFRIPLRKAQNNTASNKSAGSPIYIETPHLITRSLVAADVTPEFAQWFNDAQMLQGLNLSALHFSVDGLRAFVASFDNVQHYLIGIFSKLEDKLLGFYNFSINPQHRIATLTLGADPQIKTGREVFWESWFPLCDEVFDHRGVDKITSRVLSSNRKLLFTLIETEHFVYEATLKQEILGQDGKRLDVMVLSCFKDLALRPNPKGSSEKNA
ncbi:N-acetyltransferase [Lampropedia puyangensis]|uniref:N-acetyltransferase n=1 Tax=Lampropedia puyangensis TaxID=1330072 RepID=A0A4V4GRU6_9BURK|nr:GNAT family protein [Lampropedia puyangensis]THU01946.1 N-acetyltransferase [Lampropedia puyangensis]